MTPRERLETVLRGAGPDENLHEMIETARGYGRY